MKNRSFIENIAEKLGIIPDLTKDRDPSLERMTETSLDNFPPMDKWDHWEEYEAKSWPKKEKKTYTIVPTTCFNCESACGLTAYIDKSTNQVRKFEGNPYHPASRGRNCACLLYTSRCV